MDESLKLDSTPPSPKLPETITPPVSPPQSEMRAPDSPELRPASPFNGLETEDDPAEMVDEDTASNCFNFLGFSFYPRHVVVHPGYFIVCDSVNRREIHLYHERNLVKSMLIDEDLNLDEPLTGRVKVKGGTLVLQPGTHTFTEELFFWFPTRS